ncbi:cache domain-containing protein [Desulfosediminicola sp.]|uniref:HAMP domain-containing protein n=1 Tax=Desulfosediminicola sp. TaxID=2886825 RepID=UPI003AF296D1
MEATNALESGPKGFTILYRILTAMMLIAVIPIGGLWFISIHKAKQDWTENVFQALVQDTSALANRVDEWTEFNLRLLEQNSKSPAMLSMTAEGQNPILKSIQDTYDWVYLAFTVQPDGENIGRSDGKEAKFYGDRDYFKQVMGGKTIGKQLLMGKTSGKPALILAKPILSERQKIQGVLAIAMTLEDLSKAVTETRIGKTGYAILLDENNRLLAHGLGRVKNQLQDMSYHPVMQYREKLAGSNFVFTERGKKIVAYKFKTRMGWKLIVQQDYDEAYSSAVKSKNQSLILLAATLVSVVLMAYLLANHLATPIRRLTKIADDISKGNLSADIGERDRGDEIGALARAIERMGVSLQMAFDRLRKKK